MFNWVFHHFLQMILAEQFHSASGSKMEGIRDECLEFPVEMPRWFVHCSSGVVSNELSKSTSGKTYINDFLFDRTENQYLCYCFNFDVNRWFFIFSSLS